MVMEVRRVTGYDSWLAEEDGADDGADNPKLENLNSLAAAAKRFSKLSEFLFYTEQAASKQTEPETGADKVQLMTFHRSKGLEFPAVFMVGMCQGILPHKNSIVYLGEDVVPESVEEERRLAYVGMTRAQERLYLSDIDMYQQNPMEPSMFLEEIWPQVEQDKMAQASSF